MKDSSSLKVEIAHFKSATFGLPFSIRFWHRDAQFLELAQKRIPENMSCRNSRPLLIEAADLLDVAPPSPLRLCLLNVVVLGPAVGAQLSHSVTVSW